MAWSGPVQGVHAATCRCQLHLLADSVPPCMCDMFVVCVSESQPSGGCSCRVAGGVRTMACSPWPLQVPFRGALQAAAQVPPVVAC
jgi:hypothetical protein